MQYLIKVVDYILKFWYNKQGKWCYHRDKCKKEGRCIKCGRYICSGCNATDKQGTYGLCVLCSIKEHNVKLFLYEVLSRKPLIKPKNIKRFTKSCNIF